MRVVESVSNPRLRKDVFRLCRVGFDLASQGFDVRAKRSGVVPGPASPYCAQQLEVSERRLRISHESHQQIELVRRKVNFFTGTQESPPLDVHFRFPAFSTKRL